MATCLFTDLEGDGVAPDTVAVTLYDSAKNIILAAVDVTGNVVPDDLGDPIAGRYFYYLNPTTTGVFFIEFKGMLATSPIVIRQSYKVGFAV